MRTGADASITLDGATFVLCPVRSDAVALQQGRSVAKAVGAKPLEMDADEHDRVIARTSHLPHLAACALATVAGAHLPGDAGLIAARRRNPSAF
jgi:prephenate dehydrogenase